METRYLILFELLLIVGPLMGLLWWQIRSLRKDRLAREADEAARDARERPEAVSTDPD